MIQIFPLFLTGLILLSSASFAEKVNLRGWHITDDEIADGIAPPRPFSVSESLDYIKKTYKDKEHTIDVLDFRNNSITWGGRKKNIGICSDTYHLKENKLPYQ